MLEARDRAGVRVPAAERPDPVVSLAVGLFVVVACTLFAGGVLAVYDWTTPGAERPLFFAGLGVFLAAVVMLVATATVRHLRALR